MATAPPLLAIHPADAIQGVIDLTMREGIKLYQMRRDPSTVIPKTSSTVKLWDSTDSSRKWKAEHHISDGVMQSRDPKRY